MNQVLNRLPLQICCTLGSILMRGRFEPARSVSTQWAQRDLGRSFFHRIAMYDWLRGDRRTQKSRGIPDPSWLRSILSF
jgi:hypothetical protein